MTLQIIYSSESATPMQQDDLEEILEHARIGNAEKGITGALVYADGVFLQILEGQASAVQELMLRIRRDVRHETITVLKEVEIPFASFRDWTMAYIGATAEQVAQWAGLSTTTAMSDTLSDMRQHPSKTTQVAQGILSLLAAEPQAPTKLE